MASSTSTSSPATFDQFRFLPAEIRLRIWHYASQQPRIICIRDSSIDKSWLPPNTMDFCFYCLNLTPHLIRVNREAREETLKHYVLVDGNRDRTFYFNEWQDTILLESRYHWFHAVHLMGAAIDQASPGSRIRSLAITKEALYNTDGSLFPRTETGLKELFIIDYDWSLPKEWLPIPKLAEARDTFDLLSHSLRVRLYFSKDKDAQVLAVRGEHWIRNWPSMVFSGHWSEDYHNIEGVLEG